MKDRKQRLSAISHASCLLLKPKFIEKIMIHALEDREKMVRERRRGKLVNLLKASKEERVYRLKRKTLG